MKDEYFAPEANLLEYDYLNVVSASFDTPTVPNLNNKHCSVPTTKNGNKCGIKPPKPPKKKNC